MNSIRLVLLIAAIAVAVAVAACNQSEDLPTNQNQPSGSRGAAAPTATPDPFAPARENFAKHCVICHGANGEGGRVEVEGKRLKVPSLTKGHALEHPDDKLIKQIAEGDDEMPAFKDKLSSQEINDLVDFIRKELQGR
ncbi:MAG TPA: cytochrome c [Pyrinomonadaceae bacterium]|nr:cytochrome c [Pyrinomonadaceae bacterium]